MLSLLFAPKFTFTLAFTSEKIVHILILCVTLIVHAAKLSIPYVTGGNCRNLGWLIQQSTWKVTVLLI